jgi:hypothetical protein
MPCQLPCPNTQFKKAMPISAANKTKFWIVCCEETDVTKQISKAISDWQLPGVRSLLLESLCSEQIVAGQPLTCRLLSEADAFAASDYAIFITPCTQPCTQIKISPLDVAQREHSAYGHPAGKSTGHSSPVDLLLATHQRYGQAPQAWWFQLPTTEVRAHRIHPVSPQKSVAQALRQIEIFVRNYRLAIPLEGFAVAPRAINNFDKLAAARPVAAQQAVLSR